MFFAMVSFAPDDAGVWPIVWSRGMSIAVIGAIAVVALVRRGERMTPDSAPVIWLAVLAGALDVAANAFYVLALPLGLLSIVAVLGSLYPAATVLLARFVLAERLRPLQKLGMATALLASALLALGA
jgi:drug/metabolite transporter (DMT)-like permease